MYTASARHALEWLDQNMHTSYPFASAIGQHPVSTDGRTLPSSFIVDMQLLVDGDCIGAPYAQTEDDVKEGFFMSKVVRLQDSLVVEISYVGSDNVVHTVAQSAGIPLLLPLDSGDTEADTLRKRTIALSPCGNTGQEALDNVYGTLVVGTCSDMERLGTLVFDRAATPLLAHKVSLVDTGMRSVTVNGVRITSDFVLNAGEGVELDVSTDLDGVPVVTVRDAGQVAATYTSVEDVVSAVLSALGNPVRKINGIAPNQDGGFTLVGGDCTEVLPSKESNGGVLINNKCAKPCCGDVNKEQLEAAIKALTEAQARLLAYYQTLSNNVNNVQARLSTLLATR